MIRDAKPAEDPGLVPDSLKMPTVSISAVMKGSPKCDLHQNPMKSALVSFHCRPHGSVMRAIGTAKMSFVGCDCNPTRAIK